MTSRKEGRLRAFIAHPHVRRGTLVALLLAAGLTFYGGVIETARLVERDHVLPLSNWPAQCDGLRIDVVTDTHTGSPRNGVDKLDRLVRRLIDSDAPVVLMAGDYVILSVLLGEYVPPEVIAEHLKPLTARKRVYAVLGNHDWWKNGPDISAKFSAAGVQMIDNRAVPVAVGQCRFWLAGLGDLMEGRPDVAGTYAKVPAGAPVIALTHEPDLWPQIPTRTALTVAGHTHGGQIYPLPLRSPGHFIAHSNTLNGWIEDHGRTLFVSPGVGTSIIPVRLGVPPEISRLTLTRRAVHPQGESK